MARKSLIIFYSVFFIAFISFGQQQNPEKQNAGNQPVYNPVLSETDMARLNALPELPVPEYYRNHRSQLPAVVDNFTQPYMRPMTTQQGWECGQSAGIVYYFTYEIDRLRNVPASLPDNQYVAHFSWNFLNNGQQYVGASAFDGYEIVRAAGTPNVTEYGGLFNGGHTRWMSGYNLYYSAMHNRIYDAYQLRVNTPQGLEILKQYIYDHLDGSAVGGLANFYAQYSYPGSTLPAGTPEAGKYVMTTWGFSPSHTWTICGYNDSIRWDYNGDGQYTNHIDINGDGLVDMKDWEIGGLKFINGYGGTGWGDGGTCYMMYKCLADPSGAGGIWNNAVFIIKVKQSCEPQLTYKATVKHSRRNMLKFRAGIALNPAATRPQYYLDFPIFNYQGGPQYMQGDTILEANKTIEFGLDCSSLLGYVGSGQPAKYFFEVVEKDPGSAASGEIINFSVIDYAGGFHETACPANNVPINNNDTTRLAVVKTVNFNKVSIVTDSLPEASVNQPYWAQLTAVNGSPPYRWDFDWTATENVAPSAFPNISAQKLIFSDNDKGFVLQNLQFNFPFCGQYYNQVYANPDGFLKFDNSLYTWPFLIDGDLLFKSTKIIGAFVTNLFLFAGQGVWYEGNADSATFRWKASVYGQSGTEINVAIRLFPSGKIKLFYGNINVNAGQHWLSGISKGDNRSYQFTSVSDKFSTNTSSFVVTLIPPQFPTGLTLSEDGILSGITGLELNASPLKFRVTDNNDVWAKKIIPFSTKGVIVKHSIVSGGDSIVQAGETALMSLKIKNIGSYNLSGVTLTISDNDALVFLTDSTENVGNIAAGDSIFLPNAFSFMVSSAANEGHVIDFNLRITSLTDTFTGGIKVKVHSFILKAGTVQIADGNDNILTAGETAAMIIELKNIGGATATNITVNISTADPFINILSSSAFIDTLGLHASKNLFFIIQASAAMPTQRIVVFDLDIHASNNYHKHEFAVLIVGQLGETFETGDFTAYPWNFSGDSNWYIQSTYVYAGNYAARSGPITHNMTSSISLQAYVINDGKIFFARKVQCEADNTNHNYDWLAFYIDGTEKERWDGDKDWAMVSYDVTAGNRVFKWTYRKDYSVSTGLDAAFLDNIIFPALGDNSPDITVFPTSIFKTLPLNSTDSVLLGITNTGNGLVIFTGNVDYINSPTGVTWCNPQYYAGSVDIAETVINTVRLNSAGLTPGTYNCNLRIGLNSLTEITVPVTLNVLPYSDVFEYSKNNPVTAFPNPFRDNVTFSFSLNSASAVTMDIFDLNGKIIRNIFSGLNLPAGNYSVVWDGFDNAGNSVKPGIYFCRFNGGIQQKIIRVVKL